MASVMNAFKKRMLDAQLALGTLKVMLLNDAHTTNIDTQDTIDDVSANEISSAGYTAGGVALPTPVSTQDNANDEANLDTGDLTLTGLTATIRNLVYYIDTGTPATSPIIAIQTLGANQVLANQDLDIVINAQGLLEIL